jgi:hypothetical protein
MAMAVIGILVAGSVVLTGQIGADTSTRQVMKFKLHYSQSVLEGIATENFVLIATNAVNLSRLSQSAGWAVRQTADYQRLTRDFSQAADNLHQRALKQNVDGATVAYFQLTVSCVNCHRYLRDAKVARLGTDSAAAFIAPSIRN